MIDPYPSFKSTNALVSMSKVAGTKLTTQAVAYFRRNKRANVERELAATRVTEPVAGIMTDGSTLPCLPSSFQVLTDDHVGLDFLSSQSTKHLSLLAEPYASVSWELRMIR